MGGMLSEVRVYNLEEKKLDSMTINGYFIEYTERSKGYRYYYPSHSTRIVESRNVKCLENELINRSNQSHKSVSVRDQPSTSSDRLVIIHNISQVQTGVEQPIIEVPQDIDNIPVDEIILKMP